MFERSWSEWAGRGGVGWGLGKHTHDPVFALALIFNVHVPNPYVLKLVCAVPVH